MRDEPISPTDGRADQSGGAEGAGDTSVTRDVDLDASIERVWEALTEPEALAEWMGGPSELDARPGGGGRVTDAETATVRRVLVTESDPGRRLAFTWWPDDDGDGVASEVRFDLTPSGGGTRLTVTERPLVAPSGITVSASAATPRPTPGWCSSAAGAWTWRLAALELRCAALLRRPAGA
ncbi:MAG: SRPBCC domain-containing protein [Actinomycetota bacterium]|nr:SRPBCC domain-containing protein [Actinomycetota bacterium]